MLVLIRHVLRRLNTQRGQMLIMFVGIFTVVMLMGAITIDFGLWFSERRGAQRDADLVATAGAFSYLVDLAAQEPPDLDQAFADAAEWADKNGVDPPISSDPACPAGSCVVTRDWCREPGDGMPSVEANIRHESRSLFAGFFEIGAPDIGAHALACAGAATGLDDSVPIEIHTTGQCFNAGQPNFDDICIIEFGPPGASAGLLSLDFTGAFCSDSGQGVQNTIEIIANGAPGSCFINEEDPLPLTCDPGPWDDCVAVQAGQAQNVLTGFRVRLLGVPEPGAEHPGEGLCDGPDPLDIDDFHEVLTLVGTGDNGEPLYEPIDCDPNTPDVQASPRLMTIIVLENAPTAPFGNQGFPIKAFAGFYLVGCTPDELQDTNGDTVVNEDDLTTADRKCQFNPPIGQVAIYGRFVSLIVAGAEVVPGADCTICGIALVE